VDVAPGPTVSPADPIERGADFSPCGTYRYRLWRTWGPGSRVAFVALNPSTADATRDDPTIRRCIGFAQRWGHDGVDVVNLFAYRATHPSDLRAAPAPVGPDNLRVVRQTLQGAARVVACWGHQGGWRDQHRVIAPLLPHDAVCLGRTRAGHPRHPLFVPYQTELQPFSLDEPPSAGAE